MKAHADLKNLLKGKKIQAFVKDMCLHAYPWTERIPVEYLECVLSRDRHASTCL